MSKASRRLGFGVVMSVLFVAFFVSPVCASGATYYVDASVSSSGDGSSWATACKTIQEGVDVATDGDIVLVTNGIYDTGGSVAPDLALTNRVCITNSITLHSVNGPEFTFIRGVADTNSSSGIGDGAVRGVYLAEGATLAGFTVTNGHSGVWWSDDDAGGGVLAVGGGAIISNCMLIGNTGNYGGGSSGGTLINCTLIGNTAHRGGGVSYGMLNGCTLMGNTSEQYGGAAYNGALNNCTLTGNTARLDGGGSSGGTLNNCMLIGNRAENGGGSSFDTLNNCTLIGNVAEKVGGGSDGSTLNNCIVYYNDAPVDANYSVSWRGAAYTCTTPLPSDGVGNFTNAPLLCGLYNPYLLAGSPCIDAGTNGLVVGALDIDGEPRTNGVNVDVGCDEHWANAFTGALNAAISTPDGTKALTGHELSFEAMTSGRGESLIWSLGDGTIISSDVVCRYAFQTTGDYDVTLTFANSAYSTTVTVAVQVVAFADAARYVKPDGDDANTGKSWDDAKASIQAAVDAVDVLGATVLVTNGTYVLTTGEIAVTKTVTIESVNGPDVTVVNGGGSNRCFNLGNSACTISGFTITNGSASYSQTPGNCGGGIYCSGDTPTINNCIISGNSTIGFYGCGGGGSYNGTLNSCMLAGNSSPYGGGAHGGVLNDCILTGNTADDGGGAHDSVLNNCTLIGNLAGDDGGGAYYSTLNNCTLAGNTACSGGGVSYGTLNHCTLTRNVADQGGGACGGTLNNCIVYYNEASEGANYSCGSDIEYTCTLPFPSSGVGNFTNKPVFCGVDNPHLLSGSPCIDAGNNSLVVGELDVDGEPRTNGVSVDVGCDEYWVNAMTGSLTATIGAPDGARAVLGQTLSFEAFTTGRGESLLWSFGDGTVVSNKTIYYHSYDTAGDYDVTLTFAHQGYSAIATVAVQILSYDDALLYVAPDGNDANTGKSWGQAKATIQAAVDDAILGATVLVTNGVYDQGGALAGGNPTRVVLDKNVSLRSAMGASVTFIKGATTNESTGYSSGYGYGYRCAFLAEDAKLEGFTLIDGYAANGGGVYADDSWTGMANECVVSNNTSTLGGGFYSCPQASGSIANCLLSGNTAVHGGGSYYSTLNNCTLIGNAARDGGGAYSGSLNNCIVWSNRAATGNKNIYGGTVQYTCSSDGVTDGDDGNVTADPMFKDASNGDYSLAPNSPCIDAGNNAYAPTNVSPNDLAGNSRIAWSVVDMGVYENMDENAVFFSLPVGDIVSTNSLVGWETRHQTLDVTNDQPRVTLLVEGANTVLSNSYDGVEGRVALNALGALLPGQRLQFILELRAHGATNLLSTFSRSLLLLEAGVACHEGVVATDADWSSNQVHVVSATITVQAGAILTIDPGTIVKFADGAGITVESGGTLVANGVIFTHIADDIGGDTNLDGNTSQPAYNRYAISGNGSIVTDVATEFRYLTFETSGTLISDQTWFSHRLYRITSTVTVPSGVTLTIEPGAIIKLDANCSIIVESGGELTAVGNRAQPIVFTSIKDDKYGGDTNGDGDGSAPTSGDWVALRNNGGSIELDHVKAFYGGWGQYSNQGDGMIRNEGGVLDIKNCELAGSLLRVVAVNGGTVMLENSILRDGRWGIDGNASLVNCVIFDCQSSVSGSGSAANTIVMDCMNAASYSYIFSYCNFWNAGATPQGSGNISADPLFRDAGNGDYSLRPGSPLIDAADGLVAPEFDSFGQPRVDDPHVVDTGIATTNGIVPDIGIYEMADSADSDIDLALNWVEGPVSATVGDEVTIRWKVTNIGTLTAVGPWRDSVFLESADETLGALSVEVGEYTAYATLAPGESKEFSCTLIVPPVREATWKFGLQVNAERDVFEGIHTENNRATSITRTQILLSELPLTGAAQGTLNAGETTAFRMEQVAGADKLLQIVGSGVKMYIAYGRMPTATSYDMVADNTGTIWLSGGEKEQTVYVLLVEEAGVQSDFELTVNDVAFALTSVAVASGSDDAVITLPLLGAGFSNGMVVALRPTDTLSAFTSSSVVVYAKTKAEASFDLHGKSAGNYDVVAELNGVQSVLTGAFTVVHQGVAQLSAHLDVPSSVREGRKYTLWIEYANTGDAPMDAPLLVVSSSQVDKMRLKQTEAWQSGDMQVLAIGNSDPVGVLKPGESRRIPVYFMAPTSFGGQFRFNLSRITSTGGAVNWSMFEPGSRPATISSSDWSLMWSEMMQGIGATWDDYLSVMSENASYLARHEQETYAIDDLLSFQLMKTVGFGFPGTLASATDAVVSGDDGAIVFSRWASASVSERFRLGALGYGWTHSYDYKLDMSDYSVARILYPGGKVRSLYKTPGSSWKNTEGGDSGVLVYSSYGIGWRYRLTEQSGERLYFDGDGKLVKTMDANDNSVELTYVSGRLTKLELSSGRALDISYNGTDQISFITDPDGRVTTYLYDGLQHLTSVIGHNGLVTDYQRKSPLGALDDHVLTSITHPDSSHTMYEYDANGRLVASQLDDGMQRMEYTYGAGGAVVSKDLLNREITTSFGMNNAILSVNDSVKREQSFVYDEGGRLEKMVLPGQASYALKYNEQGQVEERRNQAGNTIKSSFSGSFSALSELQDTRGNKLKVEYDDHNNITKIRHADGSSERFSHNSNGQITSVYNRRGQRIRYQYNERGQIVQESWVADGRTFDYSYDTRGNQTSAVDSVSGTISMQYDAKDRMTRMTYPNGKWLAFAYDALGRRASRTDQDGTAQKYAYDRFSRLERLTDQTDALLVHYRYDTLGRLAREDKGNGCYTTYAYDEVDRTTEVNHFGTNDVLQSKFHYTYDVSDNVASMETLEGVTEYSYDALGQLIGVTYPNSNTTVYAYDAAGNRIRVTENGTVTTYTVNNLNQYTQIGNKTYSYDADGNLSGISGGGTSKTFTYDMQNRLIGIAESGNNQTFGYDALGYRYRVEKNGAVSCNVHDPEGIGYIAGEYAGNGTTQRKHVTAGGVVALIDAGNNADYPGYDLTGNTRIVSDENGAVSETIDYTPFGKIRSGSPSINMLYSGKYGVVQDDSDLIHMRNREYSSSQGRFVQDDPVGIEDGINKYAYCVNSPVGMFDATGMRGCPVSRTLIMNDESWTQDPRSKSRWFHGRGNYVYRENTKYFQGECVYRPDGSLDSSSDLRGTPNVFAAEGKLGTMLHMAIDMTRDGPPAFRASMALEVKCATVKLLAKAGRFSLVRDLIANLDVPINCDSSIQKNSVRAARPDAEGNNRSVTMCPYLQKLLEELGILVPQSCDPNEMAGPIGFGDPDTERFVLPGQWMDYIVYFENKTNATAPAQEVWVTNSLSQYLDWSTLELGEVVFNNQTEMGLAGQQAGTIEVDQAGTNLKVRVAFELDQTSGEARWYMRSVDPSTGDEWPTDPYAGFLPPNDDTHRGEGHLSYRVRLRDDVPVGTRIDNAATIVFDRNAPIPTDPAWFNTVGVAPQYALVATAGAGGRITPSGTTQVTMGSNQTFVIEADVAWEIADVQVGGQSQGAVSNYTFVNVQTGSTIVASFTAVMDTNSIVMGTSDVMRAGGAVTIEVDVSGSARWTVANTSSWITVKSGASGTGSGTIVLTVAENTDQERSGTVWIVGKRYVITQSARGATDIAVYARDDGTWLICKSSDGSMWDVKWGWSGADAMPADYDGDGVTDMAVYAPANGAWVIRESSNPGTALVHNWGWNGADPIPGDYDGDGTTDIAVYARDDGTWLIRKSSDGSMWDVKWGWAGANAMQADYDGDGITDMAVYAPANGAWVIRESSNPGTARVLNWGWNGADPIPGDYDGDGTTDIAVYARDDGTWLISKSSDSQMWDVKWGWSGANAMPADYDGDGITDMAVYAPADGAWVIRESSNPGTPRVLNWGWNGADPVPGDYDGQ